MEDKYLLNGMTWFEYMKQFKPEITENEASYLLMNETCFPFDDETTAKQLKDLLK